MKNHPAPSLAATLAALATFGTVALGTLAATPARAADAYVVDPAHSEVTFQVRHLVTKVRGRFKAFQGTVQVDAAKPEASSVEFTIQTASIDTDNPDRDKHLKSADFFDVEKLPTITFRSTKVVPSGKDRFDVTGTFTLHGVSKTITLPVTFLGFAKDPWGGERGGFELSLTLNRKDYGIVWNKALDAGGALLGDDVSVSINLEAKKAKPAA